MLDRNDLVLTKRNDGSSGEADCVHNTAAKTRVVIIVVPVLYEYEIAENLAG
jgi:hypothetical protein